MISAPKGSDVLARAIAPRKTTTPTISILQTCRTRCLLTSSSLHQKLYRKTSTDDERELCRNFAGPRRTPEAAILAPGKCQCFQRDLGAVFLAPDRCRLGRSPTAQNEVFCARRASPLLGMVGVS